MAALGIKNRMDVEKTIIEAASDFLHCFTKCAAAVMVQLTFDSP